MSEKQARILIFTGSGKGKTTAAFGMALRFLARRQKVLIARFCKNKTSGEVESLASFPGVRVISSTHGMTPPPEHPEFPAYAAAAQSVFGAVCDAAPGYDFIVMDEICGAAARGLVNEKDVTDFLKSLHPEQTAALTGRDAGQELMAAADTVSEILCLKHGYSRGIDAQAGVEF